MQSVAIMSRQPVYNLSDTISVTVILLIIMHIISIVIICFYGKPISPLAGSFALLHFLVEYFSFNLYNFIMN